MKRPKPEQLPPPPLSARSKELCERFGLRDGQMRAFPMHKNKHWVLNREQFGYGDLSDEDLERIQSLLDPDDIFLGWNEHQWGPNQQTTHPQVMVTAAEITFPHREHQERRRS